MCAPAGLPEGIEECSPQRFRCCHHQRMSIAMTVSRPSRITSCPAVEDSPVGSFEVNTSSR